jgi:pyridinium-3,5-bisthiocarboxylic acid mononucleotide nickel chelatase
MILFLDCASGASGDMLVAALADAAGRLGHDAGAELRRVLAAVGIDTAAARLSPTRRGGLAAFSFEVVDRPGFASFADLTAAVAASDLVQPIADRVCAVAARMAAAERVVHGGEHEPHLHELAGLDTAVDLVGAVALLDLLAPESVIASPPALGGGSVSGSHGVLPVPAPAVMELLRGLPTRGGGTEEDGELTTPTGAALLAEVVDEWGGLPGGRLAAIGVGAGGRERPGAANVLRAVLVDQSERHGASSPDPHGGAIELLETTVDDATAEVLAYAADRLRAAGALDVWLTPALMKKGRPGHVLHVLARSAERSAMAELLLRETTTFGLRVLPVERMLLDERRENVEAAGGTVRVRLGYLAGRLVTASPEFEDCRRAAEQTHRPLKEVYAAAQAAAYGRFGAA